MIRRLWDTNGGTAAIELALVAPMLIMLMMGAFELGNYFLSQHVLIKGVRDGAIFAARQPIAGNYTCPGSGGAVPATVSTPTENIVRSGQLSGGSDRLPNWSSATFSVTFSCVTTAGGTTMTGMYTANGGQVPVVVVAAQLPYRSLLGSIGLNVIGLTLGASQQSAVTGI